MKPLARQKKHRGAIPGFGGNWNPSLSLSIYIYIYLSLYIYKFTSIIVYKHGNAEKPSNQWRNASKRNWAENDTDAEDSATWGVRVFGHSPCGWWFFTGRPGYLLPFSLSETHQHMSWEMLASVIHRYFDFGESYPAPDSSFQLNISVTFSIKNIFFIHNQNSIQRNLSWFVLNKLLARRGLLCPLVSFLCQRRWTKIDRKNNWKIFRSFLRCPQFYSFSIPKTQFFVLKSISSASNVLNKS